MNFRSFFLVEHKMFQKFLSGIEELRECSSYVKMETKKKIFPPCLSSCTMFRHCTLYSRDIVTIFPRSRVLVVVLRFSLRFFSPKSAKQSPSASLLPQQPNTCHIFITFPPLVHTTPLALDTSHVARGTIRRRTCLSSATEPPWRL